MTGSTAQRSWRCWLSVGEVVGVGALIVAGLGYFDAHRERAHAQADRAEHGRMEAARSAFVLRGNADASRVTLAPIDASQVVQQQRYLFPHTVLDHAMEVSSATPQIDCDWVRRGLRERYRRRADHELWEDEMPVGIRTRYLQDGEIRDDASIYRLGFRVEPGVLFTPPRVTLLGVSVSARRVAGDLQAQVDRAWASAR